MTVRSLLATFAIAALSTTALAQSQEGTEKADGAKKTCKVGAKKSGCCGDKSACSSAKQVAGSKCSSATQLATCGSKAGSAKLAAAREAMPAMSYRVGEETTSCPKQAAELAQGDESKVRFVVGDKVFSEENEAQEAYGAALERYLEDITTVKYAVGKDCTGCPMTAKSMASKTDQPIRYRLASYDFESQDAAEKAAARAKEAAAKVSLTMKVGEKSYSCATTAAKVAKAEAKQVEFCVGEKSTPCRKTAGIELSIAKIDAALSVLDDAAQG